MSNITMKLLAEATGVNIQTMEILAHELEAMLRGLESDVRFYGRYRYLTTLRSQGRPGRVTAERKGGRPPGRGRRGYARGMRAPTLAVRL